MMDKEVTLYLAELSKIEFTDEELIKMTEDMSGIIKQMDKVCEFDFEKEPFALKASPYSYLRRDQPEQSSSSGQLLSNAKKTTANCFVVPKVI